MAMTTPVLTRSPGAASAGQMSFVLPSRFWDADGELPPSPIDGSIQIDRKGGGALETSSELACLWFGGFAGAAEVARRKDALRDAIASDPAWAACSDDEEPLLLQYNDPFTPPWARRNEVALPVIADAV